MTTTISEIAELAGVSTATVSRVFSGNGHVKEETRKKILEICSSKGYLPRTIVQTPSGETDTRKTAIVIPDIRNAYYVDICKSVEAYLRPHGLSPLLCNTNEDANTEYEYLKVLQSINVSGIIIDPTMYISEKTIKLINELDSSGTSVVLLDRDIRSAKMDGVFMENYSSVYQSIRAFVEAGHNNIAFLGSSKASVANVDRQRGYIDALTDSGIEPRDDYIYYCDFRFDVSYATTKKLIAEHPEITALFLSSRRTTSGCLFGLAELGLSVPDDIAVICGGKPDIGSDFLSYNSYPTTDIGRECGKILYSKMNSKTKNAPKRRTFFDMKLNLNGSEKYPMTEKNRLRASEMMADMK